VTRRSTSFLREKEKREKEKREKEKREKEKREKEKREKEKRDNSHEVDGFPGSPERPLAKPFPEPSCPGLGGRQSLFRPLSGLERRLQYLAGAIGVRGRPDFGCP